MTRDEAVGILDTMHLQPWTGGESPVVAASKWLEAHGGLATAAVARLRDALPGWYVDANEQGVYLQNMRHLGFTVRASPEWWPFPDELPTLAACLQAACTAHVAKYATHSRRYRVARVVTDGSPTFCFYQLRSTDA